MLGQGTFGQVAACYSEAQGCSVAVKVIKNQPAYYHQARVEVRERGRESTPPPPPGCHLPRALPSNPHHAPLRPLQTP